MTLKLKISGTTLFKSEEGDLQFSVIRPLFSILRASLTKVDINHLWECRKVSLTVESSRNPIEIQMMSGYHYRYKTCSFITQGMSVPHSQTLPGLTKSWRKEERTEQKLCSFHCSRWVFLEIINQPVAITTDLKDVLWGWRSRLWDWCKTNLHLHQQVNFSEHPVGPLHLNNSIIRRTHSSSSSSKTLLTFSSGVAGRPIARVCPGDLHKSCLLSWLYKLFSVTSLNVWRPR